MEDSPDHITGKIAYDDLLPEHHDMIQGILSMDFQVEVMKDNPIYSVTVGHEGISITWVNNNNTTKEN